MNETTFKLTKTQTFRLEKFLKDLTPTGYFPADELDRSKCEASTYDQFAAHDILILKFYDDDRISVRTLDGIEISGIELDAKLIEMATTSHLPRIDPGTNGKINSINTIAAGPSPKLLTAIAKDEIKISRGMQITLANDAMQAAEATLQDKSEEEILQYVEYVMQYANHCRRIAHTKNIQGFRSKFSDIVIEHEGKQEKKKLKIRKASEKKLEKLEKKKVAKQSDQWVFIRNEWNRDLEQNEIKFLRAAGIDPNTMKEKVLEFKAATRFE